MQKEELELIRRIASVMGHELRNPLAVINNSAYFLKSKLAAGGAMDPKVEKHLGIVSSEISRLDGMIADILSFSRPLELKPKPAPLNAVVSEAVSEFPFPATHKADLSLAEPSPEAAVDAAALKDALRRLIENAVEAAAGGGTVRLRTGAEPGPWIEVSDDGPGFPAEQLPRVMEPFFTTKPRGLGLGLSMARRVVVGLGGRLEASNGPKGGAVLRLSWG